MYGFCCLFLCSVCSCLHHSRFDLRSVDYTEVAAEEMPYVALSMVERLGRDMGGKGRFGRAADCITRSLNREESWMGAIVHMIPLYNF